MQFGQTLNNPLHLSILFQLSVVNPENFREIKAREVVNFFKEKSRSLTNIFRFASFWKQKLMMFPLCKVTPCTEILSAKFFKV